MDMGRLITGFTHLYACVASMQKLDSTYESSKCRYYGMAYKRESRVEARLKPTGGRGLVCTRGARLACARGRRLVYTRGNASV